MKAINAQFDVILSALPGIGAKAAIVAEGGRDDLGPRPRAAARRLAGRRRSCCNNVLKEANSIVGSIERIKRAAQAGSKDLDAAPLLLTTQQQVRETVANVAAYGGSLDVIVDDA